MMSAPRLPPNLNMLSLMIFFHPKKARSLKIDQQPTEIFLSFFARRFRRQRLEPETSLFDLGVTTILSTIKTSIFTNLKVIDFEQSSDFSEF